MPSLELSPFSHAFGLHDFQTFVSRRRGVRSGCLCTGSIRKMRAFIACSARACPCELQRGRSGAAMCASRVRAWGWPASGARRLSTAQLCRIYLKPCR
eukprot:6200974-Pleurochrysis_carterae.AAC.3